MPSQALQFWRTNRSDQLDQIEGAHRAVGGAAPGRRYATQQINQAYAVMLSSQFQGFCRDLHSECIKHFVRQIPAVAMREAVSANLAIHRKLDTGNPNPGNIGSDFNRFDAGFWDLVLAHHPRNVRRRRLLQDLNDWRNAVAHQDFDPARLGATVLLLKRVRAWRAACDALAESFDGVIRDQLHTLTGCYFW